MRFYNIFFSPTGGTERVADIVAKGTKLDAEEINLIKEPDKLMKVKFEKKDLCLVVVPSYGGRIPSVVTDMFRKVKADGTKAILVAVLMILYWNYRMFWRHQDLYVSQEWRQSQSIP